MTYRIVRRLAEGGFSEVFSVEDAASALPERLVLKRLTAEMSVRPEVREAFAAEAKILRELRHANVVTFRRCYFDEQGRVCLLMEHVAGEPLDAWARRHAGAPDLVLDVFHDVLLAVDYLHHRPQPYLHLDLKPDNVLVAAAGGRWRPVLIDFGIARRSGTPGLRAYTPPYAAPEQESGGPLDVSADVHALGHMLAEVLGELSLPEAKAAALGRVAERARSRSRSARYADAGAMALAFRGARRPAQRTGPAAARWPAAVRWPPTLRWPTLPPGRWRWAAAGAALALLLVVVALAGGLGLAGPADDPPSVAPGDGGGRSIDTLLAEASVAALDHRFEDAEAAFAAARHLANHLPSHHATVRAVDAVGRQIDLVRGGGSAGERSRLELHQFLASRPEAR